MVKERLIALWMANDFIPCEGQMDLYNEGQKIFGELIQRSFFQDVEEDLFGNITCKMHDLVHDLARSIMIDECKLIQPKPNEASEVTNMIRHFSIQGNSQQPSIQSNNLFKGQSICTKKEKVQSLRSFLWLGDGGLDDQAACSYLSGQKRLRVLDFCGNHNLTKLQMSIDRLKHLRYLDFSNSRIRSLPESTTSLQNLQTLNLRYCNELYKLPKGLKHLKNLMHLDITGCDSLKYMPAYMGQLTHLRKLSRFIVSKDTGHHIGELKELNLRGELCIENLYYVTTRKDANSANLLQKEDLNSLSLSWSGEGEDNNRLSEEVLDGLQPHSKLKKLSIFKYPGSEFPNWMMGLMAPNLVEIKLKNCKRCEHLPPFGELKFLKSLHLEGMESVKRIGNEIYGNGEGAAFPALERLSFIHMGSLEKWATVGGRNSFPILKWLDVYRCPKFSEFPWRPRFEIAFDIRTDSGLSSGTMGGGVADLKAVGFSRTTVKAMAEGAQFGLEEERMRTGGVADLRSDRRYRWRVLQPVGKE